MEVVKPTIHQHMNYMAIELLEIFGNQSPTQSQIDLAQELLSTFALPTSLSFDKRLTKRETMILLLVAHGRTSQETANVLKIQASTVETHRAEIKRKLECRNIAQAVFKGIQYGYLSVMLNGKVSVTS